MTTLAKDYTWLVDGFVSRTAGVAHAAVVSTDGLLIAASSALPKDRADQLSAIASGLSSLTAGAARCFDGGGVVQTVVEMERGFVMLMAISDGSSLVTLAEPACDLGLVAYEMTLLADRVGEILTPLARSGGRRLAT